MGRAGDPVAGRESSGEPGSWVTNAAGSGASAPHVADLIEGDVPGWPGAHSQGESLDELQSNLQEVVSMLLEDGEPKFESEFVAVQTIRVA